ncbi:hypothetical protein QF040_001733 [Variovorax sp. W2I14]
MGHWVSKKIVTEKSVSSISSGHLAIAGAMLLPLVGIGMLAFIHRDDFRRWRWDSVEHWMLLASAIFVTASHALMVVLLCMKPKDKAASDEDRAG